MWQFYVCTVLAGLFAANGVPHFVKGGLGQKHQTPFGKPSSAVVNVCWGWANFVVAAVFLHLGHFRVHEYRACALIAMSALLMTLFNTTVWSKHPEHNQ